MESLSIPLYVLGTVIAGAGLIYWRYLRLLRLHGDDFPADHDEVVLED